MLDQSLRRWPYIETALGQCRVKVSEYWILWLFDFVRCTLLLTIISLFEESSLQTGPFSFERPKKLSVIWLFLVIIFARLRYVLVVYSWINLIYIPWRNAWWLMLMLMNSTHVAISRNKTFILESIVWLFFHQIRCFFSSRIKKNTENVLRLHLKNTGNSETVYNRIIRVLGL